MYNVDGMVDDFDDYIFNKADVVDIVKDWPVDTVN